MKSKHGYGNFIMDYEELDNEVDTVIMGDGSIRMATVWTDEENTAGVSFANSQEKVKIGHYFVKDGKPVDANEDPLWQQKNAYIQILSDNPESLDVLIDRLKDARDHLIERRKAK